MSISTALGKRKRSAARPVPSSTEPERSSSPGDEDVTAIFRRAFEAKFAPLPQQQKRTPAPQAPAPDAPSEADDSEWSGISDTEAPLEIIQDASLPTRSEAPSGREKRAFMSSKPPSSEAKPSALTKKVQKKNEEDEGEAANLKNDLALQRLLSESHLLTDTRATGPQGKNRLKAMELRLQGLGAKKSVLEQKDMPMAHRRGIEGKKRAREEERRRDAKENGIVLERERRERVSDGKRERGVGGPSVGTFRGGMLKLSKGDVEGIQGRSGGRGGRGRGRGRGGGRGRGQGR
ncbi:hypothetical protein B9Z65_6111 [Elsinoe australis]|uniref:Uncharacterized protein n=1 Tax=Elsinoe australis TaxID=40998 RepID=A0A2P8A7P2_9PEZI|nr:hypothetical protein B9Z65_6111 [Elsinoe australis]